MFGNQPPPPPGFVPEGSAPARRRDPWEILRAEGFTATNGYRTDGDVSRIRAQGYTPRTNGPHNRGDGVDLDHPRLSRTQQEARLRELARENGWDREGFEVIDEGHHRHLTIPGWGAAPGTPGTPNFGLPPAPEGFVLEQRGPINGQNFMDETRAAAAPAPASPPPQSPPASVNGPGFVNPPQREVGIIGSMFNEQVVDEARRNALQEALRQIHDGVPDEQVLAQLEAAGQSISPALQLDGSTTIRGELSMRRELGLPEYRRRSPSYNLSAAAYTTTVPGAAPRAVSAVGRGVAGLVGAPVDLVNTGLSVVGLPVSDTPIMGSKWLADNWSVPGAGIEAALTGSYESPLSLNDPSLAARSSTERLVHRGLEFAGGSAIPVAGMMARGGQLVNSLGAARASAPILPGSSAIGQSANRLMIDTARRPGVALAAEGGAAVGSALGGQGAATMFPDNAFAETLGTVAGGVAGGFAAGLPAYRSSVGRDGTRAETQRVFDEGYRAGLQNDELPPMASTEFVRGHALGQTAARHRADTSAPRPEAFTPRSDIAARMDPASGAASPDPRLGAEGGLPTPPRAAVDPDRLRWIQDINDGQLQGSGRLRLDPDGLFVDLPDGTALRAASDPATIGRGEFENLSSIADRLARIAGVDPERARALGGRTGFEPIQNGGPVEPRTAAMEAEGLGSPEIVGPAARQVDRIDISQVPPPPPGFVPEGSLGRLEPPIGRAPRLGEQPAARDLADVARTFDPQDALPRPANRVQSIDEHIAAGEGRWQDIPAPNERRELPVHRIPNPRRPGETIRFQNVIDAETAIRVGGGMRDDGGELAHLGITNNRPRPDVPGEDRLGRLINPKGMSLDEAAFHLWERGYFPHMAERPTVDDLLDVLRASRNGQRTVLPEDVDTLDAYHQAQAQRWAVESAAQEGSILSDDPTSPRTLGDMEEPPLTAYEELPDRLGRVGNINLAHVESAEDIGRLLQNVETAFGGFNAARRGRISHEETAALAQELGMTADDLLTRRAGQALNAEQALAARSILAKSSDEVIDLARRTIGGSDADRTAFSEALLRHAAIQEQVTGAVAESGRALSALRAAAQSRFISGRIHELAAGSMGGQQRLEDVAEKILELQRVGAEPAAINRFATQALKPGWGDKLEEIWYNSLLSGPQTHAVNILSNLMTGQLQIPEQALAATLGQGRRAIRAVRGQADDFDRVTYTELGHRLIGYVQGTREGLRAARQTLRTGEVSDYVTKVESRRQEAIGGLTGKVVRTPTRLLAAEDEYFKAVARRMELAALASRYARREGLRGAEYRQRVQDLTLNPTDEMMERALDHARYLTFQKPLGRIGQRISATTQEHRWLKLWLPFVRTPTNILKYAVERSPAAPLLREVRADFRAGGERRHLATARMMFGTGIGLGIAELVEQGIITGGGPASRGAEDLMRADGWQPYSIKIGNQYYSYQRLDPLALTIGVAADLFTYSEYMTPRQAERASALLLTSIMRNLSNKTWLSGMSDIFETLSDPERNLNSFAARLGGSLAVPTGVNQIARWVDPVQRDTSAPSWAPELDNSLSGRVLGAIQNRIPGLSDNLPARRDTFGREMRSEGGLGPDLVSPIWTRAARNDPVIRELLDSMITIGRPQRFVTVDGRRQRLTPEDYGRFQEMAGRYIHDDLTALIASPEWRSATPEERTRMVRGITRDARADARADMAVPPPPPGFVPEGFVPAQ